MLGLYFQKGFGFRNRITTFVSGKHTSLAIEFLHDTYHQLVLREKRNRVKSLETLQKGLKQKQKHV